MMRTRTDREPASDEGSFKTANHHRPNTIVFILSFVYARCVYMQRKVIIHLSFVRMALVNMIREHIWSFSFAPYIFCTPSQSRRNTNHVWLSSVAWASFGLFRSATLNYISVISSLRTQDDGYLHIDSIAMYGMWRENMVQRKTGYPLNLMHRIFSLIIFHYMSNKSTAEGPEKSRRGGGISCNHYFEYENFPNCSSLVCEMNYALTKW